MCEELDEERAKGRAAASALAEHLASIGAPEAETSLTLGKYEFIVTVRVKGAPASASESVAPLDASASSPAVALAKHLFLMGAEAAELPVTLDGAEYVAEVRLKGSMTISEALESAGGDRMSTES
jgi:hypothetical protein